MSELTEQEIESFRLLMQGPSPDKTSAVIQKIDAFCDMALAHARRGKQEPVAEVTYSNWNGMNVCILADQPPVPVGTKLYATPQPTREDGLREVLADLNHRALAHAVLNSPCEVALKAAIKHVKSLLEKQA